GGGRLEHGLPALLGLGDLAQQRPDPARALVRHCTPAAGVEADLLVLRADAPALGRFLAAADEVDELVDGFDARGESVVHAGSWSGRLGGGGLFEEGLQEARERTRDLVAGVDREALAGSLGLAGAERADESDLTAALRRDDCAIAAAGQLELHRPQVLVIGPDRRELDLEVGGAGGGRRAVEALERRGHLDAQLFDAFARALEAFAVLGLALAELAAQRGQARLPRARGHGRLR